MPHHTRIAGWALVAGTVIATAGYLIANLAAGSGDARFANGIWTPMNSVALAGDILIVLGLPAILAVQGHRAARLTLAGYIGLYATLVMLNIGDGVIETYVKPYLLTHGGIPASAPGGFAIFEDVALIFLVAGLICLGIAVIRARVLGWWVGALFIASPVLGMAGLPGPLAELSDYLAFAAIFAIGLRALRHPAAGAPVPAVEARAGDASVAAA